MDNVEQKIQRRYAGVYILSAVFLACTVTACSSPAVSETGIPAYAVTKYSITPHTTPGGSLKLDPADFQAEGLPVTITVVPNPGNKYHPGSLRVTGTNSGKTVRLTPTEHTGNRWTFLMPGGDVEINAAFIDETIMVYDIFMQQELLSFIECNQSSAIAGDTVTLTLIPQDNNYRYRSGSLILEPDVEYEETNQTITFIMPAHSVKVTGITTEHILGYDITTEFIKNGIINIGNGFSEYVQPGTEITFTLEITNPADYYYVQNSLSITGDYSGDTIDCALTGDLVWTFIMPEESVTINAEIELVSYSNIFIPDNIPNGSLSVYGTSTESGMARAGDIITVTAIPDPGYRAADNELTILPAGEVVCTPLDGRSAWTFVMPDKDLNISIVFAEMGLLDIYKGGARNGIHIGELSDDKKYYPNSVDMNAEIPDRNGSRRVIKVSHAIDKDGKRAQQSFGLFSDTDIDLNTTAALSFWAKANQALSIRYAGFGDADPNKRVIYTGEKYNQSIAVDTEWKRYIVPVPAANSGQKAARCFFFNALLAIGDYVYIDNIEFIQSGVNLSGIIIPDTYDELQYGIVDTSHLFKSVPLKLVYTCDDGTQVTLQAEHNTHTLKHQLASWFIPYVKHNASGVLVQVNGIISNPMTITVSDGMVLDNFEYPESANDFSIPSKDIIPEKGYIWHTNAGGYQVFRDFITAPDPEIYSGLGAGSWRPAAKASGVRGGRNCLPVDSAGYRTLSFRIKLTTGGTANVMKNINCMFELRNGGSLTSKTDGMFYQQPFTFNADDWQVVTIPLAAFTSAGLDSNAITGYAFSVVDTQDLALRIMLDDIVLIN